MRNALTDTIFRLAKTDPRIRYIGSDLSPALAKRMQEEMPSRAYMEGVSEQYCVGMAAGMAMVGDAIPFVQTIATFLVDRAREQIRNDVCHHNLPVRLVGNGSGFAYSTLGFTHQAINDIASMRAMPNMTIVAPCDADEMVRVVEASLDWPGPMYIRMARGGEPKISRPAQDGKLGHAVVMKGSPGADIVFMSTGAMTHTALAVANSFHTGLTTSVLHFHTIKPLDVGMVLRWGCDTDLVVTIEEGVKNGGLGSAILEALHDSNYSRSRVLRLGIPDNPPHDYGTRENLLEQCGLLPAQIAAQVRSALG